MRIALLSWESLHSITVGGLAVHVSALAAALQRRGHEVHVFTRMDANQSRYDGVGGVHYHRCPFEGHSDFLTYINRMCDSLIDRLRAAEQFYGRPFDVVHGHDWLCVRALVRAKREMDRPAVLTLHSTEFGRCGNQLCNGLSGQIRDLEWEGAYSADRVICVSTVLRNEVNRLYSTPVEKMSVIYNGVDVLRFDVDFNGDVFRAHAGIASDDPIVLFVGRLTWQKGPDLLVETVPELRRHYPRAKFLFVGDGDMRTWLESRASSMGLFGAVRFLGYRNGRDLIGLFKGADIVCVPSRNEPFGIVILEAWGAAKPVVVTRNGGPSEIVRDQENGLVVDANCESIGWGLGTALSDRANAQRLGRNGRLEAEAHYSWDVIGEQTEGVYGSI